MRLMGVAVVLMSVCMGACSAAQYRPIVDAKTITDQCKYETDLRECQEYAGTISTGETAAGGAVVGAAIGAGLGAIVGAFFGANPGEIAAFGAAIGGGTGLVRGASYGMGAQRDIVLRCMQGRGYSVLH